MFYAWTKKENVRERDRGWWRDAWITDWDMDKNPNRKRWQIHHKPRVQMYELRMKQKNEGTQNNCLSAECKTAALKRSPTGYSLSLRLSVGSHDLSAVSLSLSVSRLPLLSHSSILLFVILLFYSLWSAPVLLALCCSFVFALYCCALIL